MKRNKLIWLAPVLLLAGCSKNTPPEQAVAPAQPPPAAQPAPVSPLGSEPARRTPPREAAQLTIPAGTKLVVRLDESLSTKENSAGDHFTATLEEPIIVDGRSLVPKGTTCVGRVTESAASGRMEGKADLTITLDALEVNGVKHKIQTSSVERMSKGHKKRNIGMIAGGAGLGAAIGAIAGGGKGAAIGAAAGAGAGTAGAAATGKQNAALAAESMVTFSLKAPVTI
jgi:outer membrane lipoprotein SlyB